MRACCWGGVRPSLFASSGVRVAGSEKGRTDVRQVKSERARKRVAEGSRIRGSEKPRTGASVRAGARESGGEQACHVLTVGRLPRVHAQRHASLFASNLTRVRSRGLLVSGCRVLPPTHSRKLARTLPRSRTPVLEEVRRRHRLTRAVVTQRRALVRLVGTRGVGSFAREYVKRAGQATRGAVWRAARRCGRGAAAGSVRAPDGRGHRRVGAREACALAGIAKRLR